MANTPQAKKRIRRNARRETINHSRISRIRTFIKAVESAIASGKKKEAPRLFKRHSPSCSAELQAGSFTRIRLRGNFRGSQRGLPRSAGTAAENGSRRMPGDRRLVSFLDRQKNAAIPAICAPLTGKLTRKTLHFCCFFRVSARFLCQVPLFHFDEKRHLKACADGPQNRPSGRESASGAREKGRPQAPRPPEAGASGAFSLDQGAS